MAILFEPARTFATGSSTYGEETSLLTTGDFNEDGHPDLAMLNPVTRNVVVLLANRSDGFRAPREVQVENGITSAQAMGPLAMADLNGDRHLDLVLPAHSYLANSSVLTLMVGNGQGAFSLDRNLPMPTRLAEVDLGDINGDGHLDIVAVQKIELDENSYTDNLLVLLNDGQGNFTEPQVLPAAGYISALALGDFNQDQRLDAALSLFAPSGPGFLGLYEGTQKLRILWGNSQGGLDIQNSFQRQLGNTFPEDIQVLDLNQDGRLDLLLTQTDQDVARGKTFLNNGQGFTLGGNYTLTPTGLAFGTTPPSNDFLFENTFSMFDHQTVQADFDGDGVLDLAMASSWWDDATEDYKGGVNIVTGRRNGTFAPPSSPIWTGEAPTGLTAGDFNHDGRPDLAFTSGGNAVVVFNSTPAPALTAAIAPIATQDSLVNPGTNRIRIRFSTPTTGLDVSDFRLLHNGRRIDLSNATLTSTANGKTWFLSNLAPLTEEDGTYTLRLIAPRSGIRGFGNAPLRHTTQMTWERGTTAAASPLIDFSSGSPGLLIHGDSDPNNWTGTTGNDTLFGYGGADDLQGEEGSDRLVGGDHADTLEGGDGNDRLFEGTGNGRLLGGEGDDLLSGGAGADRLYGGAGQDALMGGRGRDTLIGGTGADVFSYTELADQGDIINGFDANEDIFDLAPLFAARAYQHGSPFSKFEEFIRLVGVGNNTQIQVDEDGMGSGSTFVTLATLIQVRPTQLGSQQFHL